MTKKLLHTVIYLCLISMAMGCRDDVYSIDKSKDRQIIIDGLPLEFEIILPDHPDTRAGLEYPKRKFVGGDIIHIQGEYQMSDNTTVRKYGAMTYNEADSQWEPFYDKSEEVIVSTLTWPNNAVSGVFKAYYISGSDYLLKPGISTPEASLSGMVGMSKDVPDIDPLQSVKNETLEYGHTIRLEFEHACSYLKIEEMPAGTTTVFWLTQEEPNGEVLSTFSNGYKLSLNDNNELSLEFVQIPDRFYGDAVYVEGSAELYTNEEGEERTMAGFYLAPGQYKSFVIGYPGANSMIDYLSYTKRETDMPDMEDSNPDNILEANGVYTFNVSKSSGLTMVTPPEEDGWAQDGPPWHLVDAEAFLWAACNGLEYINEEGVKILEPTATGVRLLTNIDMNFQEYTVFGPNDKYSETNYYFEPNLDNGKVFEGGLHYIHNLGSPLFRYNNGTIQNLGISIVDATVISVESANTSMLENENIKPGFDLSRQGIICDWNTGNISNIRMKGGYEDYDPSKAKLGLYLTAYIYATDDQEAHNIGIITGSNTGTISKVEIADEITIEVKNYEEMEFIPTVNIGGLVGQNASPGTVINVTPLTGLDDVTSPRISITNECEGETGSCRIGGIAGANNGGDIESVTFPYVSIDSRQSSVYQSMIGGLVGMMSNSSNSILRSCMVGDGIVLAGAVAPSGDLTDSYSYIGGVAGLIFDPNTINNCRTVVGVGGTSTYTPDVIYGTGGAFGRIDNEGTGGGLLNDIIANGSTLRGPSAYMGNFAGIVPLNMTWEDYETNNIIVKEHYTTSDPQVAIPNIGTAME